MSTPTLKRGESANLVRKVLAEATRPLTITEITSATGTKSKQVTTLLSKWTAKQAVIRYGTQGRGRVAGYTYTIGPKMPSARAPKEAPRVKPTSGGPSAAARNFKYGEKLLPASAPQTKSPRETVAGFVERGGKIERLPGFQRDHVVARRRPVIRFVGRLE